MTNRSLALVANFHRERRIGRKTANFLGHVHARLRDRGIDFNIEFVLDRPDEVTVAEITKASRLIPDSRIHLVDFANLGISRTFGVNVARADVVCFTDGDDFFSFDWFERALNYLSQGPMRVVLHTQYMVGFDQDEFIRETTESIDPAFDPLSLAVDWYWSANLAVQTEVFASAPIQPYDHTSGFGSEDWHWSCNSLEAGIARVSLPGAAYYYRVKPEKFALGKVADVIHMASPLFAADSLPPPPQVVASRLPVAPLTPEFFSRAREVEPFELGLSYLRSVEVGAKTIRHFKPHTNPIVGEVIRAVFASGFGDGSLIVFADNQRLPGGVPMAAALGSALTGGPGVGRLYIIDGDQAPCQANDDGYEIHLGALRSAGLYKEQIDRLLARFLIQQRDLVVLNLLSPRLGSQSLAFSRATRGSVRRWINVVMEYGFDALSQSYDELELYCAAALDSENIAIFGRTAAEAHSVRGIGLVHYPALEAAYLAENLDTLGALHFDPSAVDDRQSIGETASAIPDNMLVIRLGEIGEPDEIGDRDAGPWLIVDDELCRRAEAADECVLVGVNTFLGSQIQSAGPDRVSGLRIPALTVVSQEKLSALYFKPAIGPMNDQLLAGSMPADLAWVGAIGVEVTTLREMLRDRPERISVSALIARSLARARAAGAPSVSTFSATSAVSVSLSDLACMGGAILIGAVSRRLAWDLANG